jgi:2-polyprenyl-3-methyl-5-hydroxy-6-metoxy-1,4-benzoquinol methylase
MESTQTIDQQKASDFAERVVGDGAATMTSVLAYLGDQLGLFKAMADGRPVTSVELATNAGLSERHVREWLAGMAASGYLDYQPDSRRFSLCPEHAAALANEGGPMFFGGGLQVLVGYLGVLERVKQTFRDGGGVPQSDYPQDTFEGMERLGATWYRNTLVPTWLPAAGASEQLERGAAVADVGCGRGIALIEMAKAYPRSRFVGFDIYGPNVQQARQRAAQEGVADRVSFQQHDASSRLPEQYDIVTAFDVVHDAANPAGMLRAIRRALRDDGRLLCLEIKCSSKLEENLGPFGAMMHGVSVMYCMSTSLAHGGEGLGTCGLHEAKLTDLGHSAGFRTIEQAPIENPFNNLYVLRP